MSVVMELRTKQGLSRTKLARKIGKTYNFIYRLEMGERGMSTDTLLKLSEALQVSPNDILSGGESCGHKGCPQAQKDQSA